MRFGVLAWLGCAVVLGCGGGDDGMPEEEAPIATNGDSGTTRDCTDEDGDGFGKYCEEGSDCDDSDPEITDECRRCARPNKDCPCESGTKPVECDPKDVETVQNGVKGVLVCTEGARYCRDGAWSDCEIIWMYTTFVPTE
jgi:hypothetical protein